MKAAIIEKQAEPGEVAGVIRVVEDWPEPGPPGAGEAIIRTLASALNHMDLWVGMGVPGLDLTYPRVSGCDGCGVIEAVGAGVDNAWLGRRVIFNAAVAQPVRVRPGDPTARTLAPEYELIGEHTHGAHREKFIAPIANVQDVGDADAVESAALGLVFLTAYSMMGKADLRPGQRVLITGVGGGVATAALALCRWMGCPVCVTSRQQWKLDGAIDLGADCAILDAGDDWARAVRDWTDGRGVDVVFDSIGRATHPSCIASLARGGCFVTCGATSGPVAKTNIARIFWNQLRLRGSTMGGDNEFAEVVSLFRAGLVKPIVDSVHDASDAPKAWERLENAQQLGKIVLRWSEP